MLESNSRILKTRVEKQAICRANAAQSETYFASDSVSCLNSQQFDYALPKFLVRVKVSACLLPTQDSKILIKCQLHKIIPIIKQSLIVIILHSRSND